MSLKFATIGQPTGFVNQHYHSELSDSVHRTLNSISWFVDIKDIIFLVRSISRKLHANLGGIHVVLSVFI